MANLKVEGIDVDAGGLIDGRSVSADGAKLDNVDNNATSNDTDANLRDRATHTGTQTAATITSFLINNIFTCIINPPAATTNSTLRHLQY